jgi:hypothetical protein
MKPRNRCLDLSIAKSNPDCILKMPSRCPYEAVCTLNPMGWKQAPVRAATIAIH